MTERGARIMRWAQRIRIADEMEHVTGESTRTACKETITSGRRLNGTLEVGARVSNSDGRVRLESEYQHTSQQGRRGWSSCRRLAALCPLTADVVD